MASKQPLALLLTGGGARAAYQVGVLRSLAKVAPDLDIPILTGVSAGGINVTFLAAGRRGLAESVNGLTELWMGLRPEKVFKVGAASLAAQVGRWLLRLGSGGSSLAPATRGLTDTEPLRQLLTHALRPDAEGSIPGIQQNLREGRLTAVGLSTVDWASGRTVVFTEGRQIESWERPNRSSVEAKIGVEHVMASAALPMLFPAVEIGERWYGDGGVRLTSPLSPAIHLGGRRILAVSTRYRRSRSEAAQGHAVEYPPPAQVAGVLMNAIFLDLLDQDALHLERVNRLLLSGGADSAESLVPIELELVRPSKDLGALAGRYEPKLPKSLRFLTRGLGSRGERGSDLLALLMFQRDYVEELIACGEADGDAERERIVRLLD